MQRLTPGFISLCLFLSLPLYPLTQQQPHSERERKRASALEDAPVIGGSGQQMEVTRGQGEASRPRPRAPPCCPSKCRGGCDR